MKTPEQIAGEVFDRHWSTMRTREIMAAAIEADRAQRQPTLVVIAHRETWANDTEAEVMDVDNLLSFGGADYEPEEIAATVEKLRAHGWDSIADDVEAAEKERMR